MQTLQQSPRTERAQGFKKGLRTPADNNWQSLSPQQQSKTSINMTRTSLENNNSNKDKKRFSLFENISKERKKRRHQQKIEEQLRPVEQNLQEIIRAKEQKLQGPLESLHKKRRMQQNRPLFSQRSFVDLNMAENSSYNIQNAEKSDHVSEINLMARQYQVAEITEQRKQLRKNNDKILAKISTKLANASNSPGERFQAKYLSHFSKLDSFLSSRKYMEYLSPTCIDKERKQLNFDTHRNLHFLDSPSHKNYKNLQRLSTLGNISIEQTKNSFYLPPRSTRNVVGKTFQDSGKTQDEQHFLHMLGGGRTEGDEEIANFYHLRQNTREHLAKLLAKRYKNSAQQRITSGHKLFANTIQDGTAELRQKVEQLQSCAPLEQDCDDPERPFKFIDSYLRDKYETNLYKNLETPEDDDNLSAQEQQQEKRGGNGTFSERQNFFKYAHSYSSQEQLLPLKRKQKIANIMKQSEEYKELSEKCVNLVNQGALQLYCKKVSSLEEKDKQDRSNMRREFRETRERILQKPMAQIKPLKPVDQQQQGSNNNFLAKTSTRLSLSPSTGGTIARKKVDSPQRPSVQTSNQRKSIKSFVLSVIDDKHGYVRKQIIRFNGMQPRIENIQEEQNVKKPEIQSQKGNNTNNIKRSWLMKKMQTVHVSAVHTDADPQNTLKRLITDLDDIYDSNEQAYDNIKTLRVAKRHLYENLKEHTFPEDKPVFELEHVPHSSLPHYARRRNEAQRRNQGN